MNQNNIIINKNVMNIDNYKKNLFFYEKARIGFYQLLKELKKIHNYTIFLPAYIGYSPNEGSGIDDPIEQLNYNSIFYEIDNKININVEDLKKKIESIGGEKILLLVHYFGYVDPKINEIVSYAKKNNIIIIEDCAHAFFTDFIDNKCGNYGDYCIYSLHKMFPYNDGGMLKVNNYSKKINLVSEKNYNIFEYNIFGIANKRKHNAKILYNELKDNELIKILKYDEMITPQTFPIIIDEKFKEKFYFRMNEIGYQIVALYFRMIPQINCNEYPISYCISKKILNLPVHQDINDDDLIEMCSLLKKVVLEVYNGDK